MNAEMAKGAKGAGDEIDTVWVIGAGASVPYGFPTAEELRNLILDTEWTLPAISDSVENDIEMWRLWRKLLADHDSPYIDVVLEGSGRPYRRHVHAMISGLFTSIEQTVESEWVSSRRKGYGPLLDAVVGTPTRPSDFESHRFIVFNYDRVLEHSLARGLHARRAMSAQQIYDMMQPLIIHPHGIIANYRPDSGDMCYKALYVAPFGRLKPDKAARWGAELVHHPSELLLRPTQATSWLAVARRIVFLGFGFGEDNMKLLRPGLDAARDHVEVYGTALGIGEKELARVRTRLGKLGSRAKLADVDCRGLFTKYELHLPRDESVEA